MQFSPTMSQEEKIEYYRATVRRYIAALNGKDLEGILSVFTDDAEVHDPMWKRTISGKAGLREFYTGVITRAQLKITGAIRGTYKNVVLTPVRACIPGSAIDVITMTSFNDQGLVYHYAAYWGPTDIHAVEGESGPPPLG